MAHILITGAAGFIGFHLSQALLQLGHTVLGIDEMNSYYEVSLKHSRLAILLEHDQYQHAALSLSDANELSRVVSQFQPEVVFHLAGQAGVRYSLQNPASYIESNLIGSFHLLEILKHLNVRHLLVASSSSVYGANQTVPFSEIDRIDAPLSLYAATKTSLESLAHSYAHTWAIPTSCLRLFTVYGPWGRPDMALFQFVDAATRGTPINVHGHGEMRRDFSFIDDLVDALVKLIDCVPRTNHPVTERDSLSPVAPFRTVNVGFGYPIPLSDFITAIETATSASLVKNEIPIQPGEMPITWADTRLLHALIGPQTATPLSTGVQRFVDWYRTYYSPDSVGPQ
ncbi:MAG: NAD-dependent epimerase/dehydratase family protein [Microbacteriaceae bacterium]